MLFGLRTRIGTGNYELYGCPDHPWEGAILLGERTCPGMPDDTLPWTVQKWLTDQFAVWLWNRLGRRNQKFNHIPQVAPMCPYDREHWRHLANTTEPSFKAMRPYVKLLWPLVTAILKLIWIHLCHIEWRYCHWPSWSQQLFTTSHKCSIVAQMGDVWQQQKWTENWQLRPFLFWGGSWSPI